MKNLRILQAVCLAFLQMLLCGSCRKNLTATDYIDLLTVNWMNGDIPELSYADHSEYPAPDFSLPDVNGKYHNLNEYKGKWVVLDFWNAKSVWCFEDFKVIQRLLDEYPERIVLLSINCLDAQSTWNEIVQKKDLPGLQLYCPSKSKLMHIYDIEVFPSKYIINPEGNIVYAYPGSGTTFYEVLKLFINDYH